MSINGIQQQEKVKYDAIFQTLNPKNGKVPGDQVILIHFNLNLLNKCSDFNSLYQGFLNSFTKLPTFQKFKKRFYTVNLSTQF